MSFCENKYKRWYFALMQKAGARLKPLGLVERHHVIPKSFGTHDSPLVVLTFREHFLAHWLLTKFTTGKEKRKMTFALASMGRAQRGHQRPITSWQYVRAKKAFAALARGRTVSPETKAKMRIAALNRGPEYARKMSVSKMGRTLSAETRAKLSIATKNLDPAVRAKMDQARRGYKHKPETLAKMSAVKVGHPVSTETRARMRASALGNKHNLGRKYDPETRAKMSVAIKASWIKRRAAAGANI